MNTPAARAEGVHQPVEVPTQIADEPLALGDAYYVDATQLAIEVLEDLFPRGQVQYRWRFAAPY
jgi:hypothetical protein